MGQGKKISVFKRFALQVLVKTPIQKNRIARWLKIHRTTLYRYVK